MNNAVIRYEKSFKAMFAPSLLDNLHAEDVALFVELESTLQLTETDMTIFFRCLANVAKNQAVDDTDDFLMPVAESFYEPKELVGETLDQWRIWFAKYLRRLNQTDTEDDERKARMNQVNPKYVLRNYMAQLAIDKAENGDSSLINELYELLCLSR